MDGRIHTAKPAQIGRIGRRRPVGCDRARPARRRVCPEAKRVFDLMAAFIALVLTAPLLLMVAAAIRLTSPGPSLYRGLRAGRHGTPFHMLKFRTMVDLAEKLGGVSTAADDPRITSLGRVLRRYKIDELPQFINVLTGEMSLVGPRPQVLEEVALYTPEERALLSVRPGITDHASIRFRHEGEILKGHADPAAAYNTLIRSEKIRLGLAYVRESSFRVDMRILARTVAAVCMNPWHAAKDHESAQDRG